MANNDKQTLLEHLLELRKRLLVIAAVLIGGSLIGYFINDFLVALLQRPFDQPLYYLSPIGGFEFVLKVSIVFGIVMTIPFFAYHTLRFFEPIISTRRTTSALKYSFYSLLLAIIGGAFAYFVSLPAALHFLGSVGSESVSPLISTNEYLNFVLIYIAGFAVLFQLPLLLLIINKITPLGPGGLMKKQKIVILLSFVVAAILTPTPDPVNQSIMAVPAILLYQVGIVLVYFKNRSHERSVAVQKIGATERYMPLRNAYSAPMKEDASHNQTLATPAVADTPRRPRVDSLRPLPNNLKTNQPLAKSQPKSQRNLSAAAQQRITDLIPPESNYGLTAFPPKRSLGDFGSKHLNLAPKA